MTNRNNYLKKPPAKKKLNKPRAEAFIGYMKALDEQCRQILEDKEAKKDHDRHLEASKDPEFQKLVEEDPTY